MKSESSGRVPFIAALAAAGPPASALLVAVWVIVGWMLGANPFWPVRDLNVAEAAAVRDHAEVVRLIQAGQDPNRAWPVRAGVLDDASHVMTPLEAAVAIRRLELVKLLVRHGAQVSTANRAALVDRAATSGATDIVAFLNSPTS